MGKDNDQRESKEKFQWRMQFGDREEVVLEDFVDNMGPKQFYLLLQCYHSSVKPYFLKSYLKNKWKHDEPMQIMERGDTRFLMAFMKAGDRDRILSGGAWDYDRAIITVKKVDSCDPVDDVEVDTTEVWTQIHGVDLDKLHYDQARKLASMVEGYTELDVPKGGRSKYPFIRLRAPISVFEPLVPYASFTDEKGRRHKLPVKYEGIKRHCCVCGLLSHATKECTKPFPPMVNGRYQFRFPHTLRTASLNKNDAARESLRRTNWNSPSDSQRGQRSNNQTPVKQTPMRFGKKGEGPTATENELMRELISKLPEVDPAVVKGKKIIVMGDSQDGVDSKDRSLELSRELSPSALRRRAGQLVISDNRDIDQDRNEKKLRRFKPREPERNRYPAAKRQLFIEQGDSSLYLEAMGSSSKPMTEDRNSNSVGSKKKKSRSAEDVSMSKGNGSVEEVKMANDGDQQDEKARETKGCPRLDK